MRFWKNLHQARSQSKDSEARILGSKKIKGTKSAKEIMYKTLQIYLPVCQSLITISYYYGLIKRGCHIFSYALSGGIVLAPTVEYTSSANTIQLFTRENSVIIVLHRQLMLSFLAETVPVLNLFFLFHDLPLNTIYHHIFKK